MTQRARGFTVIELMVVVLVIAVLMAIAIPSYQAYVARGHVAEAKSYLMDLAQHEQTYLLDNRDYGDVSSLVAVPADVTNDYTVTITTPDTSRTIRPNFLIQAVPKSGTLPARYGNDTLTIDESGKKTPSSGNNAW
jgi:type IV pilus assembly protein PilE